MNPDLIRSLVQTALAEDIGAGDVTSQVSIPADAEARAVIVARQPAVVAGLVFVESVYAELNPKLVVLKGAREGDRVQAGHVVCRLAGNARVLVTGERTALNFLQRLSGIATLTRSFVDAVAGTKAVILDTRKTTPTLRAVEKYAVKMGGGQNHRMGLFDAVMIKDNHRVVLGRLGPNALGAAVKQARRQYPSVPVIIEADTLEQVERALAAGADHVLLDNMTLEELREAVLLTDGRAKLEASGGVTLDTAREIAETGVDYISVGALTHSAPAMDFSLEIDESGSEQGR